MTLTQKAKKAVAAGLALSTVMLSVSFLALPAAFAAPHSNGCLVNASGTVWLVDGGMRRGFTSGEVFLSHGYNFGQVVAANSDDTSLPVGPIIVYADGTLVKGPSDPLVYLVANGQKRGFVSGSVFTGLGYSFANIQSAAVNTFADLPTGANLESATERHAAGTLVNSSGTIWKMTATGRMGIPSMDVFNSYGYMWSHIVAANAADLAATNEGVVTARTGCAEAPSTPGSVNVSAAGPASTTLIIDSTDGGNNESQSLAPLANFAFSGNGTVTSLTLARTGVSTDAMVSNVYLFDGSTRITDAGSFSSGNLTFANGSGLFTVSGSKTITVRADLDDGSYSGQTLGVNLTSVMLSSGSVGGIPVVGPVHSTANAALATVSIGAPTASGATNPGNDITVWQSTFSIGVRDVNFSRLSLRQINNIQSSDIRNFRLFVDGVQVASQANLDSNGYVSFAGFTKKLTNSAVIKVVADVIGGSSRNVQMSLRNKADVELSDTQYNVNVSASGTIPATPTAFLVNSGSVTVARATDSPSGNVTNNASGVKLAKWTVTAYGEPVRIDNLAVAIDWSGTDADLTLRNGKMYVNGSQVGSTTGLAAAGAATAAATFTTNFTVYPGTPATVELYSDIYDEETAGNELAAGDTITAYLVDNDVNNATPQVSLSPIDVPTGADYVANQLTVTEGAMTLAALASYPNQTTVAPQTNFKLGSWTLTGSTTEDINLTSLSLDIDPVTNATFSYLDLSNLYIKYGSQTTSIRNTPTAADNDWSISYSLPKNSVLTIELYGDIGPAANITDLDSVKTDLSVLGTTSQSVVAVSQLDKDGQTIIKAGGTFTTSKDASSPDSKLVDDSGVVELARFRVASTYDTVDLQEIDVNLASASAVSQETLKVYSSTGSLLATSPVLTGATSNLFVFSPMVHLNANDYVIVSVEATMATVGANAGVSGSTITAQLDSVKYQSTSSGQVNTDNNNRDANAMYAFKAVPTLNPTTNASGFGTGTLTTGSAVPIAKVTVNTNGTGTVAWKSMIFTVTKTVNPTIANGSSAVLYDADTNTAIGATVTAAGLSGAAGTGTITVSATNEQLVSGAKNYVLKATIGGSVASTDSINTNVLSSSADITDGAALGTANDAATLATSTANFVWSDYSAASHSTATFDWYSDYLIKTLPTDSQNLRP